jgi:hypothetical protein
MAGFAPPPFDPDEIHSLFILGLALVVPMPDETAILPTLRAALWARTLLVLPLLDISLLITSIIG